MSVSKIEIPQDPQDLDPSLDSQGVIGIYDNIPPERMVNIAAEHNLWHLVQATTPNFNSEVQTAELMISDLPKFLAYPVSSVMAPDRAGPEAEERMLAVSQPFAQAKEKRKVLEAVETALRRLRCSESSIQEMLLVADEMFTNAIYNAPHVKYENNGRGVERTPENGNLALKPGRLFVGTDAGRIMIGCEDGYGTLNPANLVKRLRTCFEQGPGGAIKLDSAGGAGLGTFLIFSYAMSFYAGVASGQKTIVACTFPGPREKHKRSQNLHLADDTD